MKSTKSLLSLILVLSTLCNSLFADCDWSKIKKNADGSYTYPADLNLCVGKLVEQQKTEDQQLTDMAKALSLKNIALEDSEKKAQLWSDTSSKLEDRLQKVDSLEKKSDWLWFGLGILATGAAAFTASKLTGH